jgi:putative hydrolase of the HAD superfamily
MIKNLIFDMGGVLVGVQRERAVQNFKAIGVSDADKLIDMYHHKGLFFSFEKGDIDAAGFCRLLNEHAGTSISSEAIGNAWTSMIDPTQGYKLEYLQELRKTYKLFLLTNNNPYIMGWACSPDFTPYGALSDFFDKLYISYHMKCMKPDLQIYRMLIEDAAINPAESLFIDDSELNIQAAKACGLLVFLVNNAPDWRDELKIFLSEN